MKLLLLVAAGAALATTLGGIDVPSDLGQRLSRPPSAPRDPGSPRGSEGENEPVPRAPEKSPGRRRAEREFRRNVDRLSKDLLPLSGAGLASGQARPTYFYQQSSRTLEMKAIDMDSMSDADLRFVIPIDRAPAERIPARELANAAYIIQGMLPDMSDEDLSFLAENAALALAGEPLRLALPPPAQPGRRLQDRATDAAARAAQSGERFAVSREAMRAAYDASTDGVASLREGRRSRTREEPRDPLEETVGAPTPEPAPPAASLASEPVVERVPLEAIEAAIEAREQARLEHVQAQRDLRAVADEIVCDDCRE